MDPKCTLVHTDEQFVELLKLLNLHQDLADELTQNIDRKMKTSKTIFLIRNCTTGLFMRKLKKYNPRVEWVTSDKAKNFNRLSDAKLSLNFNKLTDTCEIVKCNVTYDVVVK